MIIELPESGQVLELTGDRLIVDDGVQIAAVGVDYLTAHKLIKALTDTFPFIGMPPAKPLNSGDLIGAMTRDGAGS